jgi:hypothetical protein
MPSGASGMNPFIASYNAAMAGEDDQFKYDVAFSFCQEDEPQALELNDLIQDRFSTFLYSKRQETLAGTDGEESFSRVFATEARFVVVFFREKWGKTPFTRIEETAIRNRAFNKGYDFTLFIPREQRVKIPDWLPKPRLWYDWPRWGAKGAASVIEARIAELGAKPREETVLDHAARMNREAEFQKQRRQFGDSPAGVSQSDESFYRIAGEFEEMAKMGTELSMQVRRHGLSIAVIGFQHGLSLDWQRYANTVWDCELRVGLWNAHPPFPGVRHIFEQPSQLGTRTFHFVLSRSGHGVWIEQRKDDEEYSGEELAAMLLKWIMDRGGAKRRR